ncbi:hypothetical protein RYA05_05555 [Pseudomonas syringae pv. actinidiae]|nr:hypothetical protein [Pseudomonas syringae pv. actinidiae]
MPFISREDAATVYHSFTLQGLPQEGRDFEKALVKIFFKELNGSEPLRNLYLDNREYSSYQSLTKKSTEKQN